MKVGTDSILLGSWTPMDISPANILDIGAGNGILALMMAQKYPKAQIHAVDISDEAIKLCTQNFNDNEWTGRMHIFPTSIQTFNPPYLYDLIISNPPYFRQSLKSPDDYRTQTRHTDVLSYTDLLQNVVKLLAPNGKFYVVLPSKETEALIQVANRYNLFPQKICAVHSHSHKPPYISLLCLMQNKNICHKETLTIYKERSAKYSNEFKALTEAFYL